MAWGLSRQRFVQYYFWSPDIPIDSDGPRRQHRHLTKWEDASTGVVEPKGGGMALEKELETYKNNLPQLKENEGKFVLIQGDKIESIHTSYEDAVKDGYKKFGLTPFLVKQILTIEQVLFISRFVDPRSLARTA